GARARVAVVLQPGDQRARGEQRDEQDEQQGADRALARHPLPRNGGPHLDQDANHVSPFAPSVRAPTMPTNASSRDSPPRTSSSEPAATTLPAASTARWSQRRSTSAITWLEKITEPPPATKRCRIVRIVAAETGSTASNGSSSSSTVASVIFFFMPVE